MSKYKHDRKLDIYIPQMNYVYAADFRKENGDFDISGYTRAVVGEPKIVNCKPLGKAND